MNAPSTHRSTPPPMDIDMIVARRAELLASPVDGAELERLTTALHSALAARANTIRQLHVGADDGLLARLARLEPVHPLGNPTDPAEIQRRASGDRRCYVLENPAMVGRPLNVVWVALCRELPRGIDELLDPVRETCDPDSARIAVFYSVWNVEPGLAGIPGGSSLLSMVMDSLRGELPEIGTFTTLSPVPGMREWIASADPETATMFDSGRCNREDVADACAAYLCTTDGRGLPIDGVARFHMRNGARLWRMVPNGDRSERGWARSWGVMVNYRYWPEDLDANRIALAAGEVVVGSDVARRSARLRRDGWRDQRD